MNYKFETPKEIYNCPNCGAPVGYQNRCHYCGTYFKWRVTTIEFVPAVFDECKIEAGASIDDEYLKDENIGNEIVKRLAMQFAKELPKYWDLREEHDPFRRKTFYSATLRLRKRR